MGLNGLITLPSSGNNHMLLAFTRKQTPDSVRSRFEAAPTDSGLRRAEISELITLHNAPIFTDDHAPVEEMTRRMLQGGG